MPVRKAVVQAIIGLHARPAAQFVRAVHDTGLPVTISKDGRPGVDARSLLEVMTEDFEYGCEVELAVAPEAIPDRYSADDVEARPRGALGTAGVCPVPLGGTGAVHGPCNSNNNDGGPTKWWGPPSSVDGAGRTS